MSGSIRTIDAGGSAEEMGRAIGTAVAESIRTAVLTDPEFASTASAFAGSDYVKSLRDAAKHAYPQYMAELEAMAAAADVDTETLFIWNCRGDLRFPPDTAAERLRHLTEGCTTLMAPGSFADDVPALIAHNEDGDGRFMEHRYWLRAAPDGAPGFESYLYPGMLPGHSVAVTKSGLVQTINNIRPDDLKPGIPRHFVCRAVLDSDNIPDALSNLSRKDRAAGFHHAIGAVGEETPLSVEAPASGTVIRPVKEPSGHANHLLDDVFDNVDQIVTASSDFRQKAVESFLGTGGDPMSPEAVLFQRSKTGGECVYRRPGDGGDDYGCTLATAVFRIFSNRIEWAVHTSPDELGAITGSEVPN